MEMAQSQLPHLRQLVEPFSAEFPVRMVEPSGEVKDHQLFISFPNDQAGRARQLELIFLPHEDDVYFLQYFVALPYTVVPEKMADLARLIARLNSALPLIGFGLLEDLPLVFFRCVVPCPKRPLDEEILIHTAYTILYSIDRLGATIESLSNGNSTLAECEAQIKQLL